MPRVCGYACARRRRPRISATERKRPYLRALHVHLAGGTTTIVPTLSSATKETMLAKHLRTFLADLFLPRTQRDSLSERLWRCIRLARTAAARSRCAIRTAIFWSAAAVRLCTSFPFLLLHSPILAHRARCACPAARRARTHDEDRSCRRVPRRIIHDEDLPNAAPVVSQAAPVVSPTSPRRAHFAPPSARRIGRGARAQLWACANGWHFWRRIRSGGCAGYAAPFLSDAVQAGGRAVPVRGGLAARGAVRRAVRRLAAGGLAPWFYYENALLASANAYFVFAPAGAARPVPQRACAAGARGGGAAARAALAAGGACRRGCSGLPLAALVSACPTACCAAWRRAWRRDILRRCSRRFSGGLWRAGCG